MCVVCIAYLVALFARNFVLKSSLEIKLLDVLSEFCEKYITWEYFLG